MFRFEIVREEGVVDLEEYAAISIAFEVREILETETLKKGSGGSSLPVRKVERPYTKDYDQVHHPREWPQSFSLSNWEFFVARSGGERVGGAALALSARQSQRSDRQRTAVLWDIRVSRALRGQGIGSALFSAAEKRARSRGCDRLEVETQQINVPACRFYAKHGFALGGINPSAYSNLPDEIQLLWRKDLVVGGSQGKWTRGLLRRSSSQ